ncbi:uncharacterized protein LOC115221045 [Octopus sinensis]|uniref:Uncharacterized protein LOC115221045 n=1 Tax=Octopus sinensis TaxID=2607531 RepID=A0A6P7T8I5_9MOLL|nr:uncharacterized protein LOC115221045 [Octopus sinensis]
MSKLLQGYSRTYQSCDTLYENETEFPPELINDLNSSGFPPYILVLKKYSSIMLLRNLDPAGGHCNGTRYMVVNLHNHLIEADVADGTHAGIRIMIPRIPLTTTEDYPFSFSRKQFPLKLGFERTNPKVRLKKQLEFTRQHLCSSMTSAMLPIARSVLGTMCIYWLWTQSIRV